MGRPVRVGAEACQRLAVFAVFVGKVLNVAAADGVYRTCMEEEDQCQDRGYETIGMTRKLRQRANIDKKKSVTEQSTVDERLTLPSKAQHPPLKKKPQKCGGVELLRQAGEDARQGLHTRKLLESRGRKHQRSPSRT